MTFRKRRKQTAICQGMAAANRGRAALSSIDGLIAVKAIRHGAHRFFYEAGAAVRLIQLDGLGKNDPAMQ